VTTQAIRIELFSLIMLCIEEYMPVPGRVSTGEPIGIFSRMTPFAVVHYIQHLRFIHSDILHRFVLYMMHHHHSLFLQTVETVTDGSSVTFLAGHFTVV
jgi:hypothetical protein